MVREKNAYISAFKCIKEQNDLEAKKYSDSIAEAAKKHQDTLNNIYAIRESRELKRRAHNELVENCKNDALSTVIKAIYIEALVPESLTDDALFLAENMVDRWIQEKGGASRIISSCRNKTYLLNRICSIVEEVAMEDVRDIELLESEGVTLKEHEEAEEAKKEKVTQMLAQANALIAKATAIQNGDESVLDDTTTEEDAAPAEDNTDAVDLNAPVEEEKAEDSDASDLSDPDLGDDEDDDEDDKEEKEAEESKEDEKSDEESKEEDKDEDSDDEDKNDEDKEDEDDDDEDNDEEASELTDDDDDEEPVEDASDLSDPDLGDADELEAGEAEDQQDAEAELTGDSLDDEDLEEDEDDVEVEVDDSIDGEKTEPQGKIFDELDKEEDVQKAVQLIRQRVADAEENFIKRNAEDKKKIDDLLGKISDNIKTVEDISDNDSAESKIAQESTMMYKRKIKSITENRPQSVFERMARKLTEGITKDSDLRAVYLAESGRADMASIIETTRVMYGFLEALRTLQLEKVDEEYIANILKEM